MRQDRAAAWFAAGVSALSLGACAQEVRTFTGSGGGGGTTGTTTTTATTSTTSTTMCVPESDADFCTMLGKTCDMVTDVDNCGAMRTADCGACTGADVCLNNNTCKPPVCASLVFSATGAPIPSLNVNGVQNMVAAMTPDGSSMLIRRGTSAAPCTGYTAYMADAMPPGSMTYVVTAITPPAGMDVIHEDFATLTSDGLSLIAANTAHTAFLAATRSAPGKVDFGVPSTADFVSIVATGTQVFSSPYIGPGGLAFYYVVSGDSNAANNGIYQASRTMVTMPFGAGSLAPPVVQAYQYVTALSFDAMTAFVQDSAYHMAALTRQSHSQPFVNPNAPAVAPILPGFRTRPLLDCKTLVGTCIPPGAAGGCIGERVCTFPAM